MKILPSLLVLFLVPLCLAAEPVKPAKSAKSGMPAKSAYQGDVTDVRVIRSVEQEPRAHLICIPHIAQWKPKHLVVAYEVGIYGKSDMGSIDVVFSTDDGNTWGIPATIFDHTERHGSMQFAYANPVLYVPPGQEVIWCFAMRCPMNHRHSEDAHMVAAYSGDGGRSWNPVELAMNYTGALVIVGEIQRIMEDGHPVYLLPAHRNTRRNDPLGSREHFVLRSTSLLDWSLGGYVPQPEPAHIFLHEGQIAITNEQQHLKMVMRTSKADKEGEAIDPPRAWSTTSTDGGRTWSVAQEEPDLYNTVSEAWFGQSSHGTQLYIYNDGLAWKRFALRYKIKPAGGEWSEEKSFFDAGIKNSYPTLIEVAPGDYRAVWDSGTDKRHRREIRFGKFRLSQNPQ